MSVAVIVHCPAVQRAALNVCVPLVSVEFGGPAKVPALLMNAKVPVYPVAMFPAWSLAVTVNENGSPAIADGGAPEISSLVAADATTRIVAKLRIA